MKEEDIIKEAEEIDDHIKKHGHGVRKERGALWYILAIFLALMVVAMVVPYYGGNLWVVRGGASVSPHDQMSSINCPMLFHFGKIVF